jgi:uncharacterized membrane protein YdjX (TVP38/TMEM64 family)
MVHLPRKNIVTLIYSLLLGLLPLLGSSLVAYEVLKYEVELRQVSPFFWILFYAVAALTMAFALTPTTFVALLSGFLLGWVSLPPLCVSYLAAAWIGYQTLSRLDNGSLLQLLAKKPKAQAFMQKLQRGSPGIIILARLSPMLPFALMNAVFALFNVRLRPFLWGSFVGMLPRTVLSVWAGTQAQQLRTLLENPNESLAWRIGLVVLTLVSVVGLGYGLQRMWGKS